ncbi:MAG: citramalate synthase [Geminicoccaceae bacterium]
MSERVYLYDTTLRDGAQTQGVDFTAHDKQIIATALDDIGIDYVEGGWPGANPTDTAFFAEPPALSRSRLAAFGMTRRAGRSAANDPGLVAVLNAGTPVVTLVGKTWDRHAREALGVELDENVRMIEDSVRESLRHAEEVMFDAEHFFDGYKANRDFALSCLDAALDGGARWVVLCDTNGGTLPDEVARIVTDVCTRIPGERVGFHGHDDTQNAVANSLAALRAGARQIQGTLNGLGERCGNADLVALIPSLVLKTGYDCGLKPEDLPKLARLSARLDDILNRSPDPSRAYVGANAFAHKGGLHASAVARDPSLYEHVPPESVGNRRTIVVSDQAGRANLMARLDEIGDLELSKEQIATLLDALKEKEAQGYAYEGAPASFELLARRALGQIPSYFRMERFRVMDERRYNAKGELVTESEATITVSVGDQRHMNVADGNGPVNALDSALRQALASAYPCVRGMKLVDYKVRILHPEAGTAAVTRVLIDSADEDGRRWTTVGVSANIIEASYNALRDAIHYKLFLTGAKEPGTA